MTQPRRTGSLICILTAAAIVLAGCTQVPDNVQLKRNDDGSVTVTVLPPPGSGKAPQSVKVPKSAIPKNLLPPLPTPRPGNGGTAGAEPQVPPKKPPPDPPPTTVTNPRKPVGPTSPSSDRERIQQAYGLTITGKDANNAEYLRMFEYALNLYPAGSMRGLQVTLDQQPLERTGGVGGVWQSNGSRAMITLYQSGEAYVHVAIHELAHHLDLFVNRGRPTPDLMDAARVNGQIPAQNIPSPYAKYGLSNSTPEWGAEVISWSLDKRGVPGFSATSAWRPTPKLVERLGKYVEPGKIVFNRAP